MIVKVVTEDISNNVMVADSPARIVRQIDDEWIAQALSELQA